MKLGLFAKACFSVGLLALILAVPARAAEIAKILLGDVTLEAKIEGPRGEGPYPMIIFAPGKDTRSNERLFEKLARAANRQGFMTIRFDWLFTGATQSPPAKGKKTEKPVAREPSAGLADEAEQLSILLNELTASRMMKQYSIDPEKVVLISKGFGSRVAMLPDAGGTGAKVKASVLLAPECDGENRFKKVYAPWIATKIPRLLVQARADTGCDLAQIYEAAPEFGANVAIFTPSGNREFLGESPKDFATQDTVVATTLTWLKDLGWTKGLAPIAKRKKKKKAPSPADHKHEGHSQGAHPH